MGVKRTRYCIRSYIHGTWRIWDRKMNKWWGNPYADFPASVLTYLNERKRVKRGKET